MALFMFGLIPRGMAQTEYMLEAKSTGSVGDNAPFWLVSNQHGLSSTSKSSNYLRVALSSTLKQEKTWGYAYGLDLVAGQNFYNKYQVHQAYLDVRYKKAVMSMGSKEVDPILKNRELSSGGMSWSGNSVPIPQVKVGFPDFVSFPWLMKGLLKVKGDVSFGWFTDGKYQREKAFILPEENRNLFYNNRALYHHKMMQLKYDFKQSNWSLTVGLESEEQFGGNKYYYNKDSLRIVREQSPVRFYHYMMALIPLPGDKSSVEGDRQYVYGNTLGSWHIVLSYHKEDKELKGYYENFFDDFSGMAKQNGFDGLWGLEYSDKKGDGITGAVFEYLQTTNQSGPLHWHKSDFPDSKIQRQVSGADDYYNNFFYTGWAQYGMGMGNPLITSPVYNTDGVMRFENNRVKAFHLGVSARYGRDWSARVLLTDSRGWGRHFLPYLQMSRSLSSLLEVNYTPRKAKGWRFSIAGAVDKSDIYGDNLGVSFKVSKRGVLIK